MSVPAGAGNDVAAAPVADRSEPSEANGVVVLLTPADVAQRLAVSKDQVFKLIRNGQLVYLQIGRAYRVSEHDLAEFVAHHRQRAVQPPGLRLRPRRSAG